MMMMMIDGGYWLVKALATKTKFLMMLSMLLSNGSQSAYCIYGPGGVTAFGPSFLSLYIMIMIHLLKILIEK